MAATFPAIDVEDRDVGSGLTCEATTGLGARLHDRDEGLREAGIHTLLAEVSETSNSWVTKKTWREFVPSWASKLVIPIQTKVTNAGNGCTYRGIINLTAADDSDTPYPYETATVYQTTEEIVFSDLSSHLNTEIDIQLQLQMDSFVGGQFGYAKGYDGPASYFTI